MDYFTSSYGILRNTQIPKLFSTDTIRKLPRKASKQITENDALVGWGYKPNTQHSRNVAVENNLPYIALEDGFIGWLNHPSQSKPSDRLSYVLDKQGIYYNSLKPSGIDARLDSLEGFDQERCQNLKALLSKLGVSKYNQARQSSPRWLDRLSSSHDLKVLLLIDQTYGDASIKYSGGSEKSFDDMLDWAAEKLRKDPNKSLVIKTHPDVVLGKKKGYLVSALTEAFKAEFQNRVHVLTQDVAPKDLISLASEVAVVSSQMGFEALWYDKKVNCFAWPFYAGRGLTHDKCYSPISYSRKQCTLLELIHVALIQYPVYLHPDTQEPCEVETIVDYLQAHFLAREFQCEDLHVPNVSLWKRSFIPEFLAGSVRKIQFSSKRESKKSEGSIELIWGMKDAAAESGDSRLRGNDEVAGESTSTVWRMEDGFIRSVGLGADLRRPSSLVLDDEGIYYNGKQASRLESLLNNYQLNEYEKHRAKQLVDLVVKSAVTKYNVDDSSDVSAYGSKAGDKEIILVVGQFQKDLSMQFGAVDFSDNLSLLKKVREDFPDAYVIYKEHPDVYSGVRPGRLSEQQVLQLADEYLTDTGLLSLFSITDRVCTICSLTGFEALLRGIKVSTYGLPFYAGWGLTQDHYVFARRTENRSVEELAYIALVLYARYVDWGTRKLTTPESVIAALAFENKAHKNLKSTWLARQTRKLGYLSQALFKFSRRINVEVN